MAMESAPPGELIASPSGDFTLRASTAHLHKVVLSTDILNPSNTVLADMLGFDSTLVVTTPSIARLYRNRIEHYLQATVQRQSQILVIDCKEETKNIEHVLKICQAATQAGLRRRSQIVAIGGGVCTDVAALAAALFQRGIQMIKVPTTLIGLIDAGVGTKNAINFCSRKSLLGTFSPPKASIVDLTFLHSLPIRYISCGLAESLKMAIVARPDLFGILEATGPKLLRTRFRDPLEAATAVIRISVESLLTELAMDLFERSSYERKLDFGHTFSPYVEEASGYAIAHGEAVAIDIALSSHLANQLGFLSDETMCRILDLLASLGLPLYSRKIDVSGIWRSLQAVIAHRNGKLNLVVPSAIGSCTFVRELADLRPSMLQRAVEDITSRPLGRGVN